MRVAIVGRGPAGLYLAYRLKRSPLDVEVDGYEQNATRATFGFGVAGPFQCAPAVPFYP